MSLSGQQRKKLQEALIDAFPRRALLEQMLSFELDKNLDSIAGGNNLQEIVFDLIKGAESQEWIQDLVHAALESNPKNSKLKATAEELLTDCAVISASPKHQIERELGFPFFDNIVELVKPRIEYLSDTQAAYYTGVIITGIEERFALKNIEDFLDGESFTFWFLLKGLSQLDLSRQQKIIGHLQGQEFDHEGCTMLAIYDLLDAAGGVRGEHYYQEGDDRVLLDAGWELLVQVFRNNEIFPVRERAIAGELLANHNSENVSVDSPTIPQKQTNQQQKILILTALPHGLRLDKEIREIEEAIRRATNRDLFKICIRTAVRPQDIRRAIAEEQPQIVHFCGHGLSDGSLLLEDDGGNNKPVPPEGLASLFKLHADYVNCVLLNACHSEKTAIAISQYINYAIGMNQPIEDKAAIAFAQGFYDGLGYKNSDYQDVFQRAFDEGMVAIQLENLAQGSIPVLKKKL